MNSDKNILIAEFCGFQKTDIGWYDAEEILNIKGSNTFDELLFDEDANWLLPVGRKLCGMFSDASFDEWDGHMADIAWSYDLTVIYNGVIEAIEWVNKNKKEFENIEI